MYRYRTIALAGAAEQPRIITSDGAFEYTPGQDDILWLYRAVSGETNDRDTAIATTWTLIQNWVAKRLRGSGTSFEYSVRHYAQPTSTKWDELSDKMCQRYPESCQPHHLQNRLAARTRMPGDRPTVWTAVNDVLYGRAPNPVPRATEYAQPQVVCFCSKRSDWSKCVNIVRDECPTRGPMTVGTCTDLRGAPCQRYASWAMSEAWPDSYVRVGLPGQEMGQAFGTTKAGAALQIGIMAAIVGAGAYWYVNR